jgi:steroid delta-isomerase-like uncharacterized protein
MLEHNKRIVRRLIEEAWSRGEFAVVDDMIASNYLGHAASAAQETQGREGYKRFWIALRAAFPDIAFAVDDQIAERDRVVTRWTARGTHTGEFRGTPPTGKSGRIAGITIARIADGAVAECWTSADELGLLQQLGVVPMPR